MKAAKHCLQRESPFHPHDISAGMKGQLSKYCINDAIIFQVLRHVKSYFSPFSSRRNPLSTQDVAEFLQCSE